MLISGEYKITEDKLLRIEDPFTQRVSTYPERTIRIELCVVTDETTDKDGDSFCNELQELLSKYAI